jgi:hypothetical protein
VTLNSFTGTVSLDIGIYIFNGLKIKSVHSVRPLMVCKFFYVVVTEIFKHIF